MISSCVNCCYNPFQTISLGIAVGYCARCSKALLAPEELTCGGHLRKDLLEDTRSPVANLWLVSTYPQISDKAPEEATSELTADLVPLWADTIGYGVLSYSTGLWSKIRSLDWIRKLPLIRAEIALLSLGRAFLDHQREQDLHWPQGAHILWWAQQLLHTRPSMHVSDLRITSAVSLARQIQLAEIEVLMMRALLIADLGRYASLKDSKLGILTELPEIAATHADPTPEGLFSWMQSYGIRMLQKVFPEDYYRSLVAELAETRDVLEI